MKKQHVPIPSPRGHLKGFGSLPGEQRRKLASSGGKRSHANGNAHVFTSEEAAAAGRKSGATRRRKAEERLRKAMEEATPTNKI